MDEYKYLEFGNRLKSLRECKNIKQGKFLEKIGIARQSIGNYESGKQYPTIEILIKMADCLDCSLDYLLGRTDESGSPISKLEDDRLSKLRHFLDMLAADEAEYLIDSKQSDKNKLTTEEIVSALIRFNELDELHETVEDIKKSCLLAAVPFLSDTKKPLKRKNSKTDEFVEKFKEMLDKEE